MTPYKTLVRTHIQACLEDMTRRELATKLGFESPNFVSMILSDRYPEAVLPASRLPALCGLRKLTGAQSLQLVNSLVAGGAKGIQLDRDTLHWIVRSTARAIRERRGGGKGGPPRH